MMSPAMSCPLPMNQCTGPSVIQEVENNKTIITVKKTIQRSAVQGVH